MENTKMLEDTDGHAQLVDVKKETADRNAVRASSLPGTDNLSESQDTEDERDNLARVMEFQNTSMNKEPISEAEMGEHMQGAELGEPMEEGESGEPIQELGEPKQDDKSVELKQENELVEPKQEGELGEPMEEAESAKPKQEADSAELHFDQDFLSHFEFKTVIQDTIGALIKSDPLLSDLHPHVTVQEVNALIELEHGRAMTVYVEREDGGYWSVVVPREATVHEFKTALNHAVTLKMNRLGKKKKISWKYIWKTYFLCYEGVKLEDDNARLLDFGIRNKSSLTFKKKLSERQRIQLAARSSDEKTAKS